MFSFNRVPEKDNKEKSEKAFEEAINQNFPEVKVWLYRFGKCNIFWNKEQKEKNVKLDIS